jgi:NAD(P)H-hydrate repair Nnr-like enzyme with NAD(P)H-hydrate dehydratase domain
MEARFAAAVAAVAHGIAARLAPHQTGLVASDLLPGIQRAIAGDGWQFPSA